MRILIIALLSFFAFLPQNSFAQTNSFDAQVVTGLNRLFGEPLFIFDFAPAPFDKTGFETTGVFNPDGDDPLPLTSSTPDDAILATLIDPFIDQLLPKSVAKTADPRLFNVPLRDIETYTSPALKRSGKLPFQSAGPVIGASQADPGGPITKGDWFKASGRMEVSCGQEENSVSMRVTALIPNRIYSVWAIWLDPETPRFIPVALGGVPNAFITDKFGDATFERELNFCPVEAAKEGIEGKTMAFIDAHLHPDHALYGAAPAPILAGFPPGSVIQPHLTWNLGAGRTLTR